ncbi:hypothetical protein FRC12_004429 [Ceratobasidium sp. 428]|nr:hypothetical protein FRC12_004429 [Ceratobasidium sp. 428]
MKLHQIPSIHGLVLRWRHHADKSHPDDEVQTPERRPTPLATPPSPKSPSKRSVQISEPDIIPRVDKGKGRKVDAASAPAVPTTATATALPSPPPSPRINLRPRAPNRCSSGAPASHPNLGEVFRRYGSVSINETFECTDAVDPVRLLTLSRKTLLSEARARGGNALADEVWEYTVSKRGKAGYVVKVEYNAAAVLMKGEGFTDPQKPVAIEIAKTKGVNGLMTVTSRH